MPKVLFVDDEPNIRLTLPQILKMHGFEVHAAGSVADALAAITREKFDVLIADLNIGQPGDGFTVVSAMRRTQPQAVTMILTGFPAFESALEAIRGQVDDYMVKPAEIEHLVSAIKKHLTGHTSTTHIIPRKLWLVLRDHRQEIVQRWLELLRADGHSIEASGGSLHSLAAEMVEELAAMLESRTEKLSDGGLKAARQHGVHCREAGGSITQILSEVRLLRQVLFHVVNENLLAVNTSYVIGDMRTLSDGLDQQAKAAVEAFQTAAAA